MSSKVVALHKMKHFGLGVFLAFLGCLIIPSTAMAQADPGPPTVDQAYTLGEDDVARKTFFEPLFGPLFDSTLQSPLTGVVMIFNTALLFVAGLLVAYTIIAGILSTAHDGEMMGKKWSSVWVPLRTTLGAAAILPVVGGGWSVIQVIVIWLAMQGAGIANAVWDKFLENGESLMISATYAPPQNLPVIRDAYMHMLVSAACVAGRNNDVGEGGFFAGSRYGRYTRVLGENDLGTRGIPTTLRKDEQFIIRYGEDSAPSNEGYEYACGRVILQENTSRDLSDKASDALSRELLDLNLIGPEIAIKRRENFDEASKELMKLGEKIVQAPSGDAGVQQEVNETLSRLLEAYSRDISQAAQQAYDGAINKEFLKKISEDGFVTAGAFYMKMAKTQDQLTRLITAPVSATPGNMLGNNGLLPILHHEGMKEGMAKAEAYTTSWRNSTSVSTDMSEDATSSMGARMVSWFMSRDNEGIFGAGTTNLSDPNQNPIMMAKGVGDGMVTAAWSATALAATFGAGAAALATNVAGDAVGAGGAFKFLTDLFIPIFMIVFSSLLVPGAVLSTYVPLMPYILWLGVIFGWAVLLVEAVIAAPLWAIAHIAPDGDGVVGRGGQGYMLILSLVLRPPLMVIGLVAAIVLMKPIGVLVNSTFLAAFVMGIDNPGWGTLTSGIAGLFVYMIVMIIIIQRVFSLIHVIPDRLLRWIGGGGGELGQEAEQLGQGAWAKTAGALGSGMAVSQATQSGVHSAMSGSRQRAETAETRKQGEAQRAQNDMANLRREDNRAHASESKALSADTTGGPDSARAKGLQAASSQFMTKESVANSAAVSNAAVDNHQDAQDFTRGLKKTQQDGNPESETKYMQQESEKAREAVKAYDKDPENNPAPRPFQRALAEAAEARDKARELRLHSTMVADESIRDARSGGPPPEDDPPPLHDPNQ